VYVSRTSDVILDIDGYYVDQTDPYPQRSRGLPSIIRNEGI
jgi:hypothetical protein